MSETVSERDHEPLDPDLGAPEPEVDLAPEADVPEAEAPEPEPQAARQVPLAELMKERAKARAAAEEATKLRELHEVGNRRLEELVKALQPKPPPVPVPDQSTDPVGYFNHEINTLKQQLAEERKWRDEQAQQQRGGAEQQFWDRYRVSAAEFAQQAADFPTAYSHLVDSLMRDFLEAGFTPEEATAELHQQEQKIAAKAFKDGANPAERLYKLAKARGYKGPAPAPTPSQRLETMERGQQASRSLSGPARGENYAGLTLAQLASMSQEDFARVPERVQRRLMGG